jgi:signal peptidase I
MSTTAAPAPSRGPAHRAPVHGRGPSRPARSWDVRDVVLGVLAVIGTLTAAWLIAAAVWGLSIIVFVTGSMAPSMPTGTAAITQTVSASDLAIGDVVTVTREGGTAPVTHRIVEISTVPSDPDARSLTLQGDANSIVDSDRYVVTETRRTVAAAPGLGWVIIAGKTPVAMIALTLSVAAVIAWALWPRTPRSAPLRSTEEPSCTPDSAAG